jgi:hypothetical protein
MVGPGGARDASGDGSEPRGFVATVIVGGILVVAVLAGVCAGWVSRAVWRVGDAAIPWGLGVALAGSVGLVALAGSIRRRGGLVAVIGWFGGVVALLVRGDTILAGDGLGTAFLIVVTAAVILAATVGGGRR